jgi:hypothetical protein
MEKIFVRAVKERISPAIYKLLSNLLVAGAEGGVVGIEKEAYVNQLVDCWAGCACVLVQQGDQVSCLKTVQAGLRRELTCLGSALVPAGLDQLPRARTGVVEEDWRLGCQASSWTSVPLQRGDAGPVGVRGSSRLLPLLLRFLLFLLDLLLQLSQSLKEHYLPIFFQAIAVPSCRLTIEPEFVSLVLNLDALGDVFADLPLEKDVATGGFVLDLDLFEVKRVDILSGQPISPLPKKERKAES